MNRQGILRFAVAGAMVVTMSSAASALPTGILPWAGIMNEAAMPGGNQTFTAATGANGFDISSSGVGIIRGFEGTVGDTFDFWYQSVVVNLKSSSWGDVDPWKADIQPTVGGQAIDPGYFQITAVAMFTEKIVGISGNTYTFAPVGGTDVDISYYYDSSYNGLDKGALAGTGANILAGTGLNDGILLLTGKMVGGDTTFTVDSATVGHGEINNLKANVTWYNQDFFVDVPAARDLMQLYFTGTVQMPYGTGQRPSNDWQGGGVASSAIIIGSDPNSEFATVPEPGTMLLLGSGLLGLAGTARRRSKKG